MTITSEVVEMVFGTAPGSTRTMRVPDPRAGLEISHIETAASRFMTANPFNADVGALTSFQRADVVQTVRNSIISPA